MRVSIEVQREPGLARAAIAALSALCDAAAMIQHNEYFEQKVQSLAFERHGLKASVGVIEAGSYRFETALAERMTVVSGLLEAKLPGSSDFVPFATGTYFEVAANSAFEVRVAGPSSYLCEYFRS